MAASEPLSTEDLRACSCQGKKRYATWTAAEVALRAMHHRGKDQDRRIQYHCRFCSGWHIGGEMLKRRRGKRL
jgi:hypothetical protein